MTNYMGFNIMIYYNKDFMWQYNIPHTTCYVTKKIKINNNIDNSCNVANRNNNYNNALNAIMHNVACIIDSVQ